MTDIRTLMGWTVCGRCKTHWNGTDSFGCEYPLDYKVTLEDLLWNLRERYCGVDLSGDDEGWYASVLKDCIFNGKPSVALAYDSHAGTPFDALRGILEHEYEAQHHPGA